MSITRGHDARPAAITELPTDRRVEHLVLATDGGSASSSAMRWIADRAATHTLDVHIVAAVAVAVAVAVSPEHGAPTRAARLRAAEDALHSAKSSLEMLAPSAEVTAGVVVGARLKAVLDAARPADLLVAGTNRTGALRRSLPATFSVKLATSARCPVILVPDGWRPSRGAVVVGIAGDRADDGAIEFAAREAAILRRRLVVVHAWQSPATPRAVADAGLDIAALRREHRGRLEDAVRRARRLDARIVARRMEDDDAVRALLRAGHRASLLVLGSHDLVGLDRFLSGSVGRDVVERPPCPVVLVHPATGPVDPMEDSLE